MPSPRKEQKSTFERLDEARKRLELPEIASINQIKDKYREMSKKWHPDSCTEDPKTCHEMQQQLNAAYETLMSYCNTYQYSFRSEDVERFPSAEDFWWDRFGQF